MFRIGAVQVNRPCLLGHEEEQKLSLFMETRIDHRVLYCIATEILHCRYQLCAYIKKKPSLTFLEINSIVRLSGLNFKGLKNIYILVTSRGISTSRPNVATLAPAF